MRLDRRDRVQLEIVCRYVVVEDKCQWQPGGCNERVSPFGGKRIGPGGSACAGGQSESNGSDLSTRMLSLQSSFLP